MAIELVNGRPRSVRTEAELIRDMVDSLEAMSPDEQAAFLHYLDELEKGNGDILDPFVKAEYVEEPVDPRTFLLDEYYLGQVGSHMWPKLQDDFVELFEGDYSEAILTGSLGWGKSFFATCGLAYVLYQMSCLANPQEVYGLATGTALAIAILSATREAARRVPLAELGSKLQLSPYFKEKCPYKIAATMYEIRFPTKKMMVVAGSTSSAAIGTNVFAGFLDEMAFMGGKRQVDKTGRLVEVDKSEVLTKAIVRRMKSRFMRAGKLPGIMFLVSSKEKPVSFIEEKIAEAKRGQSPGVFIRDYSTWDVKPRENFSGKTFQIAVGSETVRSKIDPTPEDVVWYQDAQLRIIDVPEEYRPDFESDLEGALRDIAGFATESISLFIHRREKIVEAIDESLASPIDVEEWMSGEPLEFWWERVAVPFRRSIPGGFFEEAWRPIRHPGAARYVHIDPSLTGDCAGLVIAHIAGYTEVVRRDAHGESFTEVAPLIETDLMLRIIPPPGDEVFLGDIRGIVYEFQAHGFLISYASMDSFQSADTRQQFRLRGIEAEVLSVDKTTVPYDAMKTALYENRLRLQDNVLIQKELRALQRVQSTKGVIPKFMVDHPPRGTKDVSDGLAGVVHSLMTRQPGIPIAPMVSERHSSHEVRDDSWVTGGKVMVPPSAGVRGTKQGMVGQRVSAKDMPMPFTRG